MKNNEFKDILGLTETNTPEQLDAFEPQFLRGLNNRWIFDLSSRIDPQIQALYSLYDTDTNNTLDQGEVDLDLPGNGYIYLYELLNKVYYSDSPRWEGPNQPRDAQIFFRNHRAIRNGYSDENIAFPTLSYADTPHTPSYTFDSDITTTGDGTNVADINQPFKSIYLHQVPVINKNLAMRIIPNDVRSFRSGYFEFSLKTDNQNCMIFNGTLGTQTPETTTTIDDKTIVLNKANQDTASMSVEIRNGKLLFKYDDLSVDNPQSFEILSNKTIADNEWHHIVINFGKKGILTKNRKKANKRFLEFWIDSKLDVVNYEVLNKKQVFIPCPEYFFIDINQSVLNSTKDDLWKSYDSELYLFEDHGETSTSGESSVSLGTKFVGNSEAALSFANGVWNPKGDSIAYSGLFYTFVCGIHTALSPKDIQLRHSLFINDKPITCLPITAKAIIVDPIITTNKKKALKLFWNNIEQKNGIELDNNYQVETLCITHKNKISKTETYNVDISNSKEIKYLQDVKAVFTDNINIFGPGKYFNLSAERMQAWPNGTGFDGITKQITSASYDILESVRWTKYNPADGYLQDKNYSDYSLSDGAIIDLPFSGLSLVDGDRILLTNQIRPTDNGIYIFNGYNDVLTRPEDANSPAKLNNAVVRVIDGIYKDTSWVLSNSISSISDAQIWTQLESHPTSEDFNSQPVFIGRWSNQDGTIRLIDLEQDLNINQYDLIVFMNYPETNEEIKNNFDNFTDLEIKISYDNFIKSLKNVCAQGASLYVSSPKLAADLGIVKKFTEVSQQLEASDAQSASINPFEFSEGAKEYFDTHRVNRYNLATAVAGLTNKETYILTDFINYAPSDVNKQEQYHAKYAYRQLGLQEGNEFIIPGLSLRKIANNENLPGFLQNQKGVKPLLAVAPEDVITGTTVTKLANNYYSGSTVTANTFDDYVTTLVVHNNQILGGQPISGKIFVNCVEDGYTFSREEYNKAVIQTLPQTDINESVATRAWQYSTSRLNRSPRKINISTITTLGQTTPTNGGGGPLIQAPTNSSNGVVRSETDKDNINYQSDLYPREDEEIYTTQEIPVLSMTWLGLQWLAE